LCSENNFCPRFVAFCFIRYAECNNPINAILSMVFVLEKYSDVNEFTRRNYHHSFISKIDDLDRRWIVCSHLFQYAVIVDDIIKFFLSLFVSNHVLVRFVETM
jgi:hypothetical protein